VISKESSYVLGKNIESFLIEKLKKAKNRVIVASPWISYKYAKLLSEIQEKVPVKIYTSSDFSQFHIRALRSLIEEKKEVIAPANKRNIAIGIIIFLLSIVLICFVNLYAGIVGILSSIVLITISKGKYVIHYIPLVSLLRIYPPEFHVKLYIVDDTVYIGSANLTNSGMKNNYEVLVAIKDKALADALDELLENTDLPLYEIADFVRRK